MEFNGYSVKAKRMVPIQNPEFKQAKNGNFMVAGTCPQTGCGVVSFVSRAKAHELMSDEQEGSGQSGGNAMAVMEVAKAVAPAVQQASKTMETGINRVADVVQQYRREGFEKNQLTGKYDRKDARNERAMQAKAVKHYKRLLRDYDRGILPPSVTKEDLWGLAMTTADSE